MTVGEISRNTTTKTPFATIKDKHDNDTMVVEVYWIIRDTVIIVIRGNNLLRIVIDLLLARRAGKNILKTLSTIY